MAEACPAARPQRFQNGDGVYATLHTAYIGKNTLGTLPVAPGQAACCEQAGPLFVNPPPNATIPPECAGTGSMVFPSVARYTLLRFTDYVSVNGTCSGGAGCAQASPFTCEAPSPCYCVPRAVCSVPGEPAVLC